MSRLIEDLKSDVQPLVRELEKRMTEAGLHFVRTCTYRSQEEQDKLYAQGRTVPGPQVTWTRKSRHTQRRAVDYAMLNAGTKINWNEPPMKVDVDKDGVPDYLEMGLIAESLGFVWGGRWSKPDYPHVELPSKEEVA